MKVLIIGGVAGGASAAARLRRLDEQAEIVVLERSGYVSYANCGLPYYVGGVITDKEALTLQTPESFRRRFRIDVRVGHEATAIHPEQKTVEVRAGGETYEETYDKLILSPGARAVRPELPGIDDERIMTLRTVEDTFRIREYVERRRPRHATVVGGGFIGLEMAENLMEAGIPTTLLQRSAQVLPPLDYDMACQVHSYLRTRGLDLRLNTPIAGYEDAGDCLRVMLKEKPPLQTDLVLLAIGVEPDTQIARDAGLELGIKGSIVVNEYMETSLPDIYAVGDAVQVRHLVSGRPALISLAGPANKQGRIAADRICGREARYQGSQGSSVIKLFGMTAASTGLNEKSAQAAGIPYDKVVNFSTDHAGYYPGAANLTLKTLFDPESGRILGAQIVGFGGVDKRIDVLASAIREGLSAADLSELELAYAPPYSSARDPVNVAGFTMENLRSGLVRQFHWDQVDALRREDGVMLVDVRTPEEFRSGHIPGAVNIPLDELRDRLEEMDRSKTIYVNCHSGLRSYLACRILAGNGFDCAHLSGGYRFYAYVMSDRRTDEGPAYPCGIPLK
ncbi:FAD-dependent oxidoreductase [Oscillibacter sp. MSJ-2]|uniref:FAD-dependent oxidoreductase n=1 Tax=Dysosmobacter acutus TaxID=2841504 RepID=A0ABS6F5W6_9FIRM|nr:FAD-dependent oxidoreductase [Dysosmobacter acutus]MBU5625656.1 FAD-dependent oxidoreductase [Dysosmobacter acutus]